MTTMKDIDHQIKTAPLTKEQARQQFLEKTEELGLNHVFSFDEAWDFIEYKRSQQLFDEAVSRFDKSISKSINYLGDNALHAMNPTTHSFADGQYIREIYNPADAIIITKIHKKNHPFFLLEGKMTIITLEETITIEAPHYGVTKAGTKRIIYTHEPCRFVTVHRTDSTSISEIEEEVVTDSFDELNLQPRELSEIKRLIDEMEQ
mgnify:CR=1 FL=1|jgi:hypothetical protein